MECLGTVEPGCDTFSRIVTDSLDMELSSRNHATPYSGRFTVERFVVFKWNVPKHVVVQIACLCWHCNPLASEPLGVGAFAPVSLQQESGNLHVEEIELVLAPFRLNINEVEVGDGVEISGRPLQAFHKRMFVIAIVRRQLLFPTCCLKLKCYRTQ